MTGRPPILDDERAGVERAAVWLLALVAVAAIAGSVVYVAEDVRRTTPDADFAVSFDADTGTLTVEHAGGQPITDRTTRRLTVVVVDESAGTTANVTWVADTAGPTTRGLGDRGPGYPVREGNALTVDDPTVDTDGDGNYLDADRSVGVHLAANDSVRVVWSGNRQGGAVRTVTLANATLEG